MYKKTVIAEIKDKYAYALSGDMELIKIKKKQNMEIGQEIYITEEDIYEEKILSIEKAADSEKSPIFKNIYKKLAIACAFLLVFTGIFNSFSSVGYADSYISLELKEPRQILIDKKGQIKEITDINFNPVQSDLKGKKITDNLNSIIKDNMPDEEKNFVMICNKVPEELQTKLKDELENLGYEGDLLIVQGQDGAWKNAKQKRKSLSQYVLEKNGVETWNKEQNQKMNSEEKKKMLNRCGTNMEIKGKNKNEEQNFQEGKTIKQDTGTTKSQQSNKFSEIGEKRQFKKGKSENN